MENQNHVNQCVAFDETFHRNISLHICCCRFVFCLDVMLYGWNALIHLSMFNPMGDFSRTDFKTWISCDIYPSVLLRHRIYQWALWSCSRPRLRWPNRRIPLAHLSAEIFPWFVHKSCRNESIPRSDRMTTVKPDDFRWPIARPFDRGSSMSDFSVMSCCATALLNGRGEWSWALCGVTMLMTATGPAESFCPLCAVNLYYFQGWPMWPLRTSSLMKFSAMISIEMNTLAEMWMHSLGRRCSSLMRMIALWARGFVVTFWISLSAATIEMICPAGTECSIGFSTSAFWWASRCVTVISVPRRLDTDFRH